MSLFLTQKVRNSILITKKGYVQEIRMSQGRVFVPEGAFVSLPKVITEELVAAIFNCGMDEDGHVHSVHRKLPWAEKARFEAACTALGEEYQVLWAQAAVSWASILNADNEWDYKIFHWCYAEPMTTWLIQEVRLTETGIWFVVTVDSSLLTLEEFQFEYGKSLQEHMEEHVAFEGLKVRDLIAAVSDKLVTRKVMLSYPDGSVGPTVRVGPSCIKPQHWQYGAGETFMDVVDD